MNDIDHQDHSAFDVIREPKRRGPAWGVIVCWASAILVLSGLWALFRWAGVL